jgi:23S rRNA pseudouridine1911/1915/1917 synthase
MYFMIHEQSIIPMNDSIKHFYIPAWPVFYDDNHLFALYKPAGLLIQGDRTGDITLLDLAKQWIKFRYQKPGRVFLGLVHRLDRPVAGVVLFCRTSKSAGRVTEQFKSIRTRKQYIAIVEGTMTKPSGQLVNHIKRRGSSGSVVHSMSPDSAEAKLSYRLLDTHKSLSLLEIDLYTGKHHQIRLQLSHLGYPVLGDLRYGASGPMPKRQIALFARSLSVIHPTQNKRLTFTSPLPDGWPWPNRVNSGNSPPWNWQEIQERVMESYHEKQV